MSFLCCTRRDTLNNNLPRTNPLANLRLRESICARQGARPFETDHDVHYFGHLDHLSVAGLSLVVRCLLRAADAQASARGPPQVPPEGSRRRAGGLLGGP